MTHLRPTTHGRCYPADATIQGEDTAMAQPIPFPYTPANSFRRIEQQLGEVSAQVADLAARADTRDQAISRVEAGLREVLDILTTSRGRIDGGDAR